MKLDLLTSLYVFMLAAFIGFSLASVNLYSGAREQANCFVGRARP